MFLSPFIPKQISKTIRFLCCALACGYFIAPSSVLAAPIQRPVTPIHSCADLVNIQNDLTGNYVLIADINCHSIGFTPIGSSSTPFTGTLNGDGHKISNLIINPTSGSYAGLFAATNKASLQNLTLEGINVNAAYYVGTLIGQATDTTVINVHAQQGKITSPNSFPGEAGIVGGLIGSLNTSASGSSSIQDSTSSMDIQVQIHINGYVGGLVGNLGINSTIDSSYATGTVTCPYCIANGGLVGFTSYSTTDSSTTSVVKNSYATGAVSGSMDYTGGLIGYNGGQVLNSHSTGSVSGQNSGGLIGMNGVQAKVSNSYATGASVSSSDAGGLIAVNDGQVLDCYALGTVSGGMTEGGLVGSSNNNWIINSYWDVQTSGQSTSAGGVGKTTAEMYQQSTYIDWDFINIWKIQENEGYPSLQNAPSSKR